jgi:hypothetical protein
MNGSFEKEEKIVRGILRQIISLEDDSEASDEGKAKQR